MGVFRVREAQQRLQIHLPGRRAEQVCTPYHLIDPGQRVIHGDGQLVNIDPVGPAHHKISTVSGQILPVSALDPVIHCPRLIGHTHTPGGCSAEGGLLRVAQIPAGAGIYIGAIRHMGGIDAVELAAGAVAGVKQPHSLQLFKVLPVDFAALALGLGLLIPVKAQPLQILPENFRVFRAGALGVQILHPQHHMPPCLSHAEPGHQCREHIAQMHPP